MELKYIMPTYWSADLTSSVPSSMTAVNTSGNTQNHSGPSPGLFMSNTAADGWDILGVYSNSDQAVAAQTGLIIECTVYWDDDWTFQLSTAHEVLQIRSTYGLDYDDTASFSIFRTTTLGLGCFVGSGTAPDDISYYEFSADTLYTVRMRIQSDGSVKAYIDDGDTGGETFIGSSKVGASLHTDFTAGTDVFVNSNIYKAFSAGPDGIVINSISIYTEGSGGSGSGSGGATLLDRTRRNGGLK